MKLLQKSILIVFLFSSFEVFSVNRTWTGAVNNVFNNVGNWTGGGALSAIDNFTVNSAASITITLNANITVNNLSFNANSPGGSGINRSKLDVLNRTLTVNGTFSCNPVRYNSATQRDEVQIDAGTGAFIFNGTATFQTTGGGDTFIEAAAAGQGTMTFNSTLTLGQWAYTTPTIEPDFIYDAPVAQTVNYNSNNFVVPASMIFGNSNSPTVTYTGTGTTTNFSVYDGTFRTNNASIADINAFDCNAFTATSTIVITNNSEIQIGGDSDFPATYGTRTIGATSTVTYDGPNAQNVTAFTYGHIKFGGANAKTSLGNFSIRGDWTNNGTFAHGNDVHTFNGTPDQTIGGTNLTTFYRITENKGSGKILLDRNTRAANRLTLTNGVFDLNGHDMRINATATAAVQRTNGYILSEQTNMSSTFTRTINSSGGNKLFPFGTAAGDYIPFTYSRVAGNVGRVTVATYTTAANNTPYAPTVSNMMGAGFPDNSASAVDRFWDINVTGAINANLTYTYANSETPANGELNLRAQQWNNGTSLWQASNVNIASQTSNAIANTVTANGVTNSISQWTLALDLTPLPIELISFNGECNKQINQISWSTASEINNDYFSLEKSIDAKNFELVEQVDGAGNSNSLITYSSIDKSPYKTTYYRLKQTDFDGHFEYSKIISVKSCEENSFDFTPFQKNTGINLSINSNVEGDHTIEIMDLQGRNILSEQKYLELGTNTSSLNPNIRSGIYFVRIVNNNTQEMFIKKMMYSKK